MKYDDAFFKGLNSSNTSTLFISSLRCLERIDFYFLYGRFRNHMRRQIAIAVFPLQRWIRVGYAIPSRRVFFTATAAITFLIDLMANSAIIGTSTWYHKRTLSVPSNHCTNHLNDLPLLIFLQLEITRFPLMKVISTLLLNRSLTVSYSEGKEYNKTFSINGLVSPDTIAMTYSSSNMMSFFVGNHYQITQNTYQIRANIDHVHKNINIFLNYR